MSSSPADSRRSKLAELRARGIEPYGGRFERNASAEEVHRGYPEFEGRTVRMAGRLMAVRSHGRATFADLEDASGRIQLQFTWDALGPERYALLSLLDLGDFLGVEGEVFRTRRGEITVRVHHLEILCKSLRPLPDKWHGLRNPDLRHRQRYLDLIANPEVRETFRIRSKVLSLTRRYFEDLGFLEVETPVLHPLAGGATARPFRTHHHALDMDLDLRIALELHLKRLLVGGLERVFEIGRVFRNEGISTRHNPEFTMLELYQAFGDRSDMMALVEGLLEHLCTQLCGGTQTTYQGQLLDFRRPWAQISVTEALRRYADVDWLALPEGDAEAARQEARRVGLAVSADEPRGHVLDRLLAEFVEPHLVQPTFLTDHPVEISPLAKRSPRDPRLADRFEAFVAGRELANAFSELNDPLEQRQRFEEQVARRRQQDEEVPPPDEDFLIALEHGMPPAGGLGIGMDRLVMLFTDQPSIREVILFPLARPLPEEGAPWAMDPPS